MALEPLVAVGYLLGGKVIQFTVTLKQSREIRKSPMRSACQMQNLLGESFEDPKEWEAFRKMPR